MNRIHWSEMLKLMEKGGNHQLKFVKKKTGEIVNVEDCTISSIHTKGSTINILIDGEQHPKTIRKCLIVEFNGKRVYL